MTIPICPAAFQTLDTLFGAVGHDSYQQLWPNMDCYKGLTEIRIECVLNLMIDECSIFRIAHDCFKLLHPYLILLVCLRLQHEKQDLMMHQLN
jgi:hypothetical protein